MIEQDVKNELRAAGNVLAALDAAGFYPRVETRGGCPTNAMTLTVPALAPTRYRVIVERVTEHASANPLASNVTYVPWVRPDHDPRAGDVFPPLAENHPAADMQCLLCPEPLRNGRQIQLLVLGPETEEDRAAHASGQQYSAVAAYCHAACVQGAEPAAETEPAGG